MTAPILIHPFDLYILLRDTPDLRVSDIVERGTMTIERKAEHETYTCEDRLLEVGGILYCETATVTPITKEFK